MKAAIVLESYRDGVSVVDVARRHGVSGPQLHGWRRAAWEGVLAMPDDDMLGLVPVVVEAGGGDGGGKRPETSDVLVVELADARIRVPPVFDADHLARIFTALRALS